MICPHCKKDIPDPTVAKHLAAKGGSKSKRTITIEQQEQMQQARASNLQITTKTLAQYFGCSTGIIIDAIKRGELLAEMINGKYQIRIRDAAEWMRKNYTGADEREKMFLTVQLTQDLIKIKKNGNAAENKTRDA